LFKYDDLIINPIQIANAFNGYFINEVDSLQTEHVNIHHAFKLLQSSFPHSSPETLNIPITETDTVCTINSMNNKNSSGFDEISNRL
jgi:hypothetical protein